MKLHQRPLLVALIICTFFLSSINTPIYSFSKGEASLNEKSDLALFVKEARKINPTTIEIKFSNNTSMFIDFYGENIFRMFKDINGGIIRDPQAKPEADILVRNPRASEIVDLNLANSAKEIVIATQALEITFNKENTLFKIKNKASNKIVTQQLTPLEFSNNKVSLTLNEDDNEYFYGGGVQNGRFSHKGKSISIENQNSWTDGGVASPTPFYWSTNGYGVMWHTFKKGVYNFGATQKGKVILHHQENYLDIFFMVSDGAVALLNDFYQLTGEPIFLPKFSLYEGHLNAYNRDYWTEDKDGILFEDGKRYKESQKNDGKGIKESLNGELNNYQFSARAVIDRYNAHDMPLGWILVNDGYGAGYGQTSTLDSNVLNLKEFTKYANQQGVENGLWTQSDLHPKEGVSALLQRDIVKEVKDAGVRVLKTDVAWVGPGYSFGLNGVADAAQIMNYYGEDSRPFIISLDGWAGTQRYAGIWSGDQSGGEWEYIRFHIPTYIGSGLSGQPNICSDMDGIFGGKNVPVNVRDFQWKTFSTMQLNMDGWGANPKYPHILGEPAASINRLYLKMKSEMLPYAYSISEEAIDGKPMIRAMFLEDPNPYTYGKATQYQYMFGPYFLIAPIYQDTKSDSVGNDIRNGIYLPSGEWIDYFSGDIYKGGRIINNFDTPLWKIPVFVKSGAIIPMSNASNNPNQIDQGYRAYEFYPSGTSSFTEYDDDGKSNRYQYPLKEFVETIIKSDVDEKNNLTIKIAATTGNFSSFIKDKSTEIRVNVTQMPKKLSAKIGKKKIKLSQAKSIEEYNSKTNVYFYEVKPNLNRFATKGSEFENVVIEKNPMLLVKLEKCDVTINETTLNIAGFVFAPKDRLRVSSGALEEPMAKVLDTNITAYTVKPTWNRVNGADFYEIQFNDMLYSTIKEQELLFMDLKPETEYSFDIRAVNSDGYSDWATFSATTKVNPLEFAITGIKAECTVPAQGGQGLDNLFNFDEKDTWHTSWSRKAVPFDLTIDLVSVNTLDKFHYMPRNPAGNGVILEGTISYSMDKERWSSEVPFTWERSGEVKIHVFKEQPQARYIKIKVSKAVGDFGSGQELYVFKVPNTASYLPGDINNDKKIDRNDLTSYMNYTGLRLGDADFEGYVSIGDINKNNLIDAYDISNVTTQLDGGVEIKRADTLTVDGTIRFKSNKMNYKTGEIVEIKVYGDKLQAVNALSFAIAYNNSDYEYIMTELVGVKDMENLTNDRLHTNGVKSLYPTFANIGNKTELSGDMELCVIKFRAKRNIKFNLKATDTIIVDKKLNSKK